MAPADRQILKREVSELQRKYPSLSDDNAYVLWFVHAFLVPEEVRPEDVIVGGAADKGIDAIFSDHRNRKHFIVQGKYRVRGDAARESHSDVIAFASLASILAREKAEVENLTRDANPLVRDRLNEVYGSIHRKHYALDLYFVTTGKISSSLDREAQQYVSTALERGEFRAFGRRQVLNLLHDYLHGAAPPVPSLDLPVEAREGLRGGGMIRRFDPSTGVESWVFSMLGSDVGRLYTQAGVRLFSRNVRGFLGSTDINRGMRSTLKSQPENFWYFNNGVTFVCDGAKRIEEKGREVLRVYNPQIINGQQTTRVLSEQGSGKSSVLARVITVPREEGDSESFETLVSDIVAATNYQTAIVPSDLRANDDRQVRIDREFKRLGYQYLRKRQAKAEAKRIFGIPGCFQVRKEDLAKAVAACEFDPVVVRLGKERLFGAEYYDRIFDGRPARDYLMFVWLNRLVRYGARGRPERAYARCLVLHSLWRNLKDLLGRDQWRDRFIYINERRAEEWRLKYLDDYTNFAFLAALAFYRKHRGKGERALDVSTFFKRVGLHEKFARFWSSSSNKYRGRARRVLTRFRADLQSTTVS